MAELAKESKLLAKHSTIYAVGGFLQRITAFLLLPLYTRYLTPFDYGVQELIALSTDVVALIVATGVATALLRVYFGYDAEKDRVEVLSTALSSLGVVGLIVLGLMFVFAKPFAGLVLDDTSLYRLFWISFTTLWFAMVNNITSTYLRAKQQSFKLMVMAMVRLLLGVGSSVYLVVVLKMGVAGILLSGLFVAIVNFCVLSIPLLREVGLRIHVDKLKNMLEFGLPLVPAELSRMIVNLSDRYFIRGFMSVADAGLYSLGYRFSVLPSWVIGQPFANTWQPRRLEIYKQENAGYIFSRVFTYFLTLILFGCLGIAVLTQDTLMLLVDSRYWTAGSVVPVLVLANLLFSLPEHFQLGLLIARKTKYLAWINIWNALIVLLCNWFLIREYGLYGAAWATVIAFAFKCVATYIYGQRFFYVAYEKGRILKLVLVTALVYGFSYLIRVDSIVLRLVLKLAWVLSFPFLLLSIRFFSAGEMQKGRTFLNKTKNKLLRREASVPQGEQQSTESTNGE